MATYSIIKINKFFSESDNARTTSEKGKKLEDLACYIFEKVPGVSIAKRNVMNTFATEEIDVALWNDQSQKGLYFLPNIILIECKNSSSAVSSIEVSWFAQKLESRGLDFGILIAANGITGSRDETTRANSIVAQHLGKGRKIIIISREEIQNLNETNNLIQIIKEKLLELAVAGVVF